MKCFPRLFIALVLLYAMGLESFYIIKNVYERLLLHQRKTAKSREGEQEDTKALDRKHKVKLKPRLSLRGGESVSRM